MVELELIQPSQTNPRTRFDGGAEWSGFVEDIRTRGVVVPILLRQNPPFGFVDNVKPYELVAGERRFRAALEAGLTGIPAHIQELDDLAALEAQMVENVQRETLSPMDEARGYRQLVAAMAAAEPAAKKEELVQRLAERVGKAARTVYGAMKLTELIPEAQQAINSGRLMRSHGDLLVRLPEEEQQAALSYCLAFADDEETPSVRELKRYVERTLKPPKPEPEPTPVAADEHGNDADEEAEGADFGAADEEAAEPGTADSGTPWTRWEREREQRNLERRHVVAALVARAKDGGFDAHDLLAESMVESLGHDDCRMIVDALGWNLETSDIDFAQDLRRAYYAHWASDRKTFIVAAAALLLQDSCGIEAVDSVLKGYGLDPVRVRAGEIEEVKPKAAPAPKKKPAPKTAKVQTSAKPVPTPQQLASMPVAKKAARTTVAKRPAKKAAKKTAKRAARKGGRR